MINYSLLFTYNKDVKTLDLFNNKIKNEVVYVSKEAGKISIDEYFEITNRMDKRIKEANRKLNAMSV